jgi:DNA polymerase-3 subunit epsilon
MAPQTLPTTLTVTPLTSSKLFLKFSNGENESLLTMPTLQTTMKPTDFSECKDKARQWAQERLADANTVILDLESTGILREDPETEIAQICITNVKGRPLFSMLLKPSQPMSEKVIGIHKIANEDIINQPIFPQIAKMIAFVLKDKHVVAFNADFDWRLLMHMFKKYEVEVPKVAGISCAMDRYSEWCGEWSEKKQGWKWQKLPNFLGIDTHDALNDCLNTLRTMEKMAGLFNEEELTADDISLDF